MTNNYFQEIKNPLIKTASTSATDLVVDNNNNFVTYVNNNYGYTVLYPSDWTKIEPDNGKNVFFVSDPSEKATIGISSFILSNPDDNSIYNQFSQLKDYANSISGLQNIIWIPNLLLANNPSVGVIYIKDDGTQNFLGITVIGNIKYYFTYTANEQNSQLYLPILIKMLKSFNITTNPPPTSTTNILNDELRNAIANELSKELPGNTQDNSPIPCINAFQTGCGPFSHYPGGIFDPTNPNYGQPPPGY